MNSVTAVNLMSVKSRVTTTVTTDTKTTVVSKTVTTQMTIVTEQCSTRIYMMVTLVVI